MEKKDHTLKNIIIASLSKLILFVGRTFHGRHHDYAMLKAEFPSDQPWFETIKLLVDLGFQGIQTDYAGQGIQLPYKKPRKSKSRPDAQLTDQQKLENRALSKVRILVEHAIGGIKRYGILVQPFRNRKENFQDDVIAIAAGLWNFWLL
ncbi:MAG: hypothetical protein HS126_24305 [Anaerolineales bacterium]|nr:hypothetical protein [Anaerolineales bacterium]MBE7554197.1 hypothetical protein [Anaerolineales bacterium]